MNVFEIFLSGVIGSVIGFLIGYHWKPKKHWADEVDWGVVLISLMYGNPPGGWSDPDRIASFQKMLAEECNKIDVGTRKSFDR